MREMPVSIGEWIEAGEPTGVWFTIQRELPVNDTTPEGIVSVLKMASSMILRKLSHMGNFQTRQLDPGLSGGYFPFKYNGNQFIAHHSWGTELMSGEPVHCASVGIDAMIVEETNK
jgi:hypothetical protein